MRCCWPKQYNIRNSLIIIEVHTKKQKEKQWQRREPLVSLLHCKIELTYPVLYNIVNCAHIFNCNINYLNLAKHGARTRNCIENLIIYSRCKCYRIQLRKQLKMQMIQQFHKTNKELL